MKAIKFLSMMLCLVASMTFAACGDDDKDEPGDNGASNGASIVGEWEYEYDGYYLGYIFNSDGTFGYEEVEEFTNECDYGYGTYEYSGNTLILFESDEPNDPNVYAVLSLTASRLVLEDEYGDRYTLYRVD